MLLKVISTGSSGNCYILRTKSGQRLIIECGISFKKFKEALEFDLSNIVGCLVSHCHNDHAYCIADVLKAGIKVYSSSGTFQEKGVLNNESAVPLTAKKTINIGDFKIMPFEVKHDAPQPFGFLINHPESGNILFVTDTYFIPYRFSDLRYIMIECNYDEEILNENTLNNSVHPALRYRVLHSHMELDTVKNYLQDIDTKNLRNIVLIHLSSGNSHALNFKKEIESMIGKPVTIADNGLTINFNLSPF